MITFQYKGYFIHDNFTDNRVRVQTPDNMLFDVKSVHAAKLLITKLIKEVRQ